MSGVIGWLLEWWEKILEVCLVRWKERFEVFRGADGQFYFRIVAANNRILAHSEGYSDKRKALHGARVARGVCRIVEID